MVTKELTKVWYLAIEILIVAALFGIVSVFAGYTQQADEINAARRDAATDLVEYSQIHSLVGNGISLASDYAQYGYGLLSGYRTASGAVLNAVELSDLYATLPGTYPNLNTTPYYRVPAESVSFDEFMFFISRYPDYPFVLSGTPGSWSSAAAIPVTYRLITSLDDSAISEGFLTSLCPDWDDFLKVAASPTASVRVGGVLDDMTGGPALLVCWFST